MAISKERKEEVLTIYADWMKRSQAVILVEYTGVKMKDLDAIRSKIRESGGEFHIVKNTLARRAFAQTTPPVHLCQMWLTSRTFACVTTFC